MAASIDDTDPFLQWMKIKTLNTTTASTSAACSPSSKGSDEAELNLQTFSPDPEGISTKTVAAATPAFESGTHSNISAPAEGALPPPCTPASDVNPRAPSFDNLSVIPEDEQSMNDASPIDSPSTGRAFVTPKNDQHQYRADGRHDQIPLTSANLNKLDYEPDDPDLKDLRSSRPLSAVQRELLDSVRKSKIASNNDRDQTVKLVQSRKMEDQSPGARRDVREDRMRPVQHETEASSCLPYQDVNTKVEPYISLNGSHAAHDSNIDTGSFVVVESDTLGLASNNEVVPGNAIKMVEGGQAPSAISGSPLTTSATIVESPVATAGAALQARIEKLAPTKQDSDRKDKSARHDQALKTDVGHNEDRTHLTHFENWGTPTVRECAPAKVRTITLSHLPLNSDLTLVQSLIHGGSIERMTIFPSGTAANVTFTSAEACDKYYDMYPNGITFKHKGTQRMVFVDKTAEVDVMSGILQAQLECGASRVIRATGADPDWTMRALHKIASGLKNQRKVESITDMYREEVRTVIFRFTNIGDAVSFRGILLRESEWDGCSIQFADDPCEKAKAIHME